jgi:hypothetical protein
MLFRLIYAITLPARGNGMSKKGNQESNFTYSQSHNGKFVAHKGMPITKCSCGFEILVVPDLKAMNRAIKNHVAKHKKSSSEKLTTFLTEQILISIENMNPA